MSKKPLVGAAALIGLAGAFIPATAGADSQPVRLYAVTVTVENAASSNQTAQTPVWVGLHDGSFDLYDRGAPASPGLESLAEDGATGGVAAEFAASGAGVDTTIVSEQGIPPLLPGEKGSFTFYVDVQRDDPQYLSFASMVLPSNDAFIANGDPLAIPVFDDKGRFVPADVVVTGAEVLDAGTEVNDELPATTAFFGQAAPNTGDTEGAGVELHPGFIPGGRILSEERFKDADFTADGYEALKIKTEAQPADLLVDIDLTGDQSVPSVETDADGEAKLRFRKDGGIDFDIRAMELDGLTVAHIHLGAPGATGPVIVDLLAAGEAEIKGRNDDRVRLRGSIGDADLVGPLAGTTTVELWSEIRRGNAYINLHTERSPAGEIRGDLGND